MDTKDPKQIRAALLHCIKSEITAAIDLLLAVENLIETDGAKLQRGDTFEGMTRHGLNLAVEGITRARTRAFYLKPYRPAPAHDSTAEAPEAAQDAKPAN